MKPFPPNSTNGQFTDSVDITVTQEGIYQISLSDLGWKTEAVDLVQLYHRGQPVPLWITRDEKQIKLLFFGEASKSVYTGENVYQLKVGSEPGLRMEERAEANLSKTAAVDWIYRTTRPEQNTIYSPLVEEGDHWFWTRLLAPSSQTLEYQLQDLAAGEGRFRVALWGNTESAANPDHHATVSINGHLVGDSTWDGQTRHTLEGVIPNGFLETGTNHLEIEIPGDIGPLFDMVYLDWVEITFPTSTRLSEDQTLFTTDQGQVELVDPRSETFIFDISNPSKVTIQTVEQDRPVFQGQKGHRYLAVNPGGWFHPDTIEPTTIYPDLKASYLIADYLAIGSEDLLTPLTPLLDLRAGQGLNPMAVPVSAIYDQFNGGIAEPQAIQAFLAYTAMHWETPPKYVLMVGDASYDFRGYTNPNNIDHLPVIMIQTVFGGETGSDVLLAEINEDPWPDIAIGRIPAQTPEQIEGYVKKVLWYEGEVLRSNGIQQVLAVADGQESIFKNEATHFLDLFPDYIITTLLAPTAGDTNANQAVKEAIESGTWLTAYFGHGSIKMWGKDRLFSIEDVVELVNPKQLPIMLHFTCLTGLFTHPKEESLTESLLWHPDGGAIAIVAPTSLTLSFDQELLSDGFVQALFQTSHPRLGDVVLSAWRQMPVDSPNTRDVMRTFLLFGDPALSLPILSP